MVHQDRRILIAISLVVIIAGAFFASPYIVVRKAGRIAAKGDATALARYVDFPAVQASVESALTAMVLEEMEAADYTPSPLEITLMGALVRPVVETLVSPAGLSAMLKGQPPQFDDTPAVVIEGQAMLKMRYQGLNRFAVTLSDKADAPQSISMVFGRKGLSWQMIAITFTGM